MNSCTNAKPIMNWLPSSTLNLLKISLLEACVEHVEDKWINSAVGMDLHVI
jgi:hypothetical protein